MARWCSGSWSRFGFQSEGPQTAAGRQPTRIAHHTGKGRTPELLTPNPAKQGVDLTSILCAREPATKAMHQSKQPGTHIHRLQRFSIEKE